MTPHVPPKFPSVTPTAPCGPQAHSPLPCPPHPAACSDPQIPPITPSGSSSPPTSLLVVSPAPVTPSAPVPPTSVSQLAPRAPAEARGAVEAGGCEHPIAGLPVRAPGGPSLSGGAGLEGTEAPTPVGWAGGLCRTEPHHRAPRSHFALPSVTVVQHRLFTLKEKPVPPHCPLPSCPRMWDLTPIQRDGSAPGCPHWGNMLVEVSRAEIGAGAQNRRDPAGKASSDSTASPAPSGAPCPAPRQLWDGHTGHFRDIYCWRYLLQWQELL